MTLYPVVSSGLALCAILCILQYYAILLLLDFSYPIGQDSGTSSDIPIESNFVQLGNSFGSQVGSLPTGKKFVLSSLAFDPSRELRIGRKGRWYIAMSIDHLEHFQLVQSLLPGCRVRVPYKAKTVQCLHSRFNHGGILALLTQSILISLPLDLKQITKN